MEYWFYDFLRIYDLGPATNLISDSGSVRKYVGEFSFLCRVTGKAPVYNTNHFAVRRSVWPYMSAV